MGMHLLVQQLGHLFGGRKQYFHPRFFAALIHFYSRHSSQQRTSNFLKHRLIPFMFCRAVLSMMHETLIRQLVLVYSCLVMVEGTLQ